MHGISTQAQQRSPSTCTDPAADLALLRTRAPAWETTCSPNEDLRAAVLSWPGQMWGREGPHTTAVWS